MRIPFPFVAYTHDDLCRKIRDYFLSFGKGCRIIRRADFLEEIWYPARACTARVNPSVVIVIVGTKISEVLISTTNLSKYLLHCALNHLVWLTSITNALFVGYTYQSHPYVLSAHAYNISKGCQQAHDYGNVR